jgi:hypothetical protein
MKKPDKKQSGTRMMGSLQAVDGARVALGLTREDMVIKLGFRGNGLWYRWSKYGVPYTVELAARALLQAHKAGQVEQTPKPKVPGPDNTYNGGPVFGYATVTLPSGKSYWQILVPKE